jgi:hypothetical protein
MSAVCPNGHTSESEDYCDTCGSPIDPSAVAVSGADPALSEASSKDRSESRAEAGTPSGAAVGAASSAARGGAGGHEVSAIPASSLDLDAPEAPSGLICPNCETENSDGALFCEACGYDFTTGAMPRGSAAEAAAAANKSDEESAEPPFTWVAEVWVDPDWYSTQETDDPCPSPGLPLIVPLRHKSLLLGRVSSSRNTNPEVDLSSDPGVSRRHAQLTTDGQRWFVEDLDSSNGTFVGEAAGPLPTQPIPVGPKRELGDDDRLYVGAWTRVVIREATPEEVEAYA